MVKLINAKSLRRLLLLISFALLCLITACGGSKDEAAATNTDPVTTAAYLNLSASPRTVDSAGTTFSTITISALNSSHAVLPDVVVTMGANTGILSAANVVTDSTGKATVTFSNDSNPINRTAIITGTAGAVTGQTLVQIVGSKITLFPTGPISLSSSGLSPVTLTATVYDAGDNPVTGTPVTITKTGTGNVTITPASGVTDSSGQFSASIAGSAVGSVTLAVTALGATATKEVTISSSGSSFGIDKQWLNSVDIGNPKPTAMKIGDQLAIEVNAPTSTSVEFATTIGSWVGGTTFIQVTVVGGKAIATLNTTLAGIANVQVYDPASPVTSDALTVGMASSAIPYTIMLQAASNVVPKSVGTTTGTTTLTATVRDATVPTGVLVAGAPVAFSIINPTGGGESVYPVVVMTGSDGKASTTFSSGSVSSDPAGVKIRASAIGTTPSVETGTSPSGDDASIIIGGTGGSVAFGQATTISEDSSKADYIFPMSVLVADSSGHAVPGARVSLSLWPIAWSTGSFCTPSTDDGISKGTFWSEDVNSNLILDPGEDGRRIYYATGVTASGTATLDGKLTPVNSNAGSVPSGDIYTNDSGVAAFNLTYAKSDAIWTVVRMRASTIVQGSETVGEIIFRLPAMIGDVTYFDGGGVKTCKLGDSHYIF
jgi:hypothetical protein